MKPSGLRRLYSCILLIVFMLPGIISITVIFASHFNTHIETAAFLEMENESETSKKGSEENNIGYNEYCTGPHTEFELAPLTDANSKSNSQADINYKESIYLSIPTPPPDFFMV